MLDGYTVIILIERVGWADLGTSNSCKDKLPHGTAQAGAWRLNGVFMTPGFGTCCGALLGAMPGPALEVQCAWWVPIFPLLLLLLFLVAEMTLQLTGSHSISLVSGGKSSLMHRPTSCPCCHGCTAHTYSCLDPF